MDKKPWVLASRSPRRALLLKEAGLVFEQMQPPYEDPPMPQANGFSPEEQAMQIAYAKAKSLMTLMPNRHLLAADTLIVLPDGSLAGTPTSVDEARELILKMVNAVHHVVTGVAIVQPLRDLQESGELSGAEESLGKRPGGAGELLGAGESLRKLPGGLGAGESLGKLPGGGVLCLADTAGVRIGLVTGSDIDRYLQTNAWQGKAGGYNLFERQQAGWPIEVIDGNDPTTVVGLPMELIKPYLGLSRFV